MIEHIRDLYRHCAWADGALWKAIGAHPSAFDDATLWKRLHHTHLVQHAFVSVIRGERMSFLGVEQFPDPVSLRRWAQDVHGRIEGLLAGVTLPGIEESVVIPWFQNPPLRIAIRDALIQAALHSHYHRAQNATRLRELGGTPPHTDYIVWVWQGRPSASWPE